MNHQPVAVGAAIAGVVSTAVALAAVLWPERLSPELQASIIAFANAVIVAAAAVWAASRVTPVSNPTLPSGTSVRVQGTEDKVLIAPTPPGPVGIDPSATTSGPVVVTPDLPDPLNDGP